MNEQHTTPGDNDGKPSTFKGPEPWPESPAQPAAEASKPPAATPTPPTTDPRDVPQAPTAVPVDPNAEVPLRDRVVAAIATVYDPEIPVNIWELGLIYVLEVDDETGAVKVDMTLTSPACPVAGTLPGDVETKIRAVEGVTDVALALVWEPTWDKERLSEAAKLQLGLM
jgi:FeS assembly SUF system protein